MMKVVEYYLLDKTLNIFVSDGTTSAIPVSIRVPCSYNVIMDLVIQFRNALMTCIDFEAISDELYDLLIEPITERGLITKGEHIYIAPHRCLHYVPFQALGTNENLMQSKHAITYVPVGQLIEHFNVSRKVGTGCLVIKRSHKSDNAFLRQSFEREAAQVVRATNGELLSGNKANVDQISQRIKGKSIVHFTCHGKFDQAAPKQSGLLLADDHGRDMLCDLATLRQVPFHVDLVVLAACETGLSDRHPGDELVGLVRALTTAGAKSVIATLWPVHTLSTEIFMKRLYSELQAGKTKSESLRVAQSFLLSHRRDEIVEQLLREIELRGDKIPPEEYQLLVQRVEALNAGQDDRAVVVPRSSGGELEEVTSKGDETPYAHPYYWAPFVLIGAWK